MSSATPTPIDRRARRPRRPALGFAALALLAGACRDEPAPTPASGTDGSNGEREPISYLVGPKAGRWVEHRTNRFDPDLDPEQAAAIAELESLGYSDGKHDAPTLANVTRYDAERAQPGLNLVTSAHGATAMLIDMAGERLHEWSFPFRSAWPNYPHQNKLATFWRRVQLLPNGDLIAIYEGLGIIRVDKDSNLIWKSPVRAHHDLAVLPSGKLLVLSREAHIVPAVSDEKPVLEDFVSVLGPNGKEIRRFSLLEALAGSAFDEDWGERIHLGGDLLHTNSLEVLDGSLAAVDPAFAAGNLLVSMLLLDLVAIVNPQTGKVVWGHVGPYKLQHDPQVLPNGRVMIFDNQGAGGDASRILEMNPATWEIEWSYEGTPAEPFFSETCGLAQRLPNGNTLVTETDYGRAFEIAPDGTIVWEFYNPHRAGDEGQYIATLMEVHRLPADFPTDWVEGD